MIQRPLNGGPDEMKSRRVMDEGQHEKVEINMRTLDRANVRNASWKEWEKLTNAQKRPENYLHREGAPSVQKP